MAFPSRLLDRPVALSVALAAVLVWSVPQAYRGFTSVANDVVEWMPADFQATHDLARFVALFQTDELMMVCWEDQQAGDPRAEALAEALVRTPPGRSDPLFREAISSGSLMRGFGEPPLEWDRDRALESTAGWLTSRDGSHAGVLAVVSPAGSADRAAALEWLRRVAADTPGLEGVRLRVAGPSVESVAVDRASQDGLLSLNLASFALCTALLVLFLRSWRAALVIFLLALFNEQLCLAIAWQVVGKMDSIMMLAANMTFVLSISIGVHLFNYYRDALREGDPRDAPARAIVAAWQPTFFSVLTTAIGLSALAIGSIKPVARFGVFASVGLLVAAAVMVVYLPLHFRLWPLRTSGPPGGANSAGCERWSRRLKPVAGPIALLAATCLFAVGSGAVHLKTTVGLADMLRANNQLLVDYRWIEEHVGPLIPIEVVITTPEADPKQLVRQFRAVDAAHRALESGLGDVAVLSAVNFTGDPPATIGGFRGAVQAAAFQRGLQSGLETLGDFGLLRSEESANYWRLSIRASLFRGEAYGDLTEASRAIVADALSESGLQDDARVLVAGGVPLVYQAQQRMLDDLIASFTLTFMLILVAMAFVLRGVGRALLCMVPNLLPIGLVFGSMGWANRPVDVGAVMTATAALGVAVDDTLHFLKWFRLASAGGASRLASVASAWRTCGSAMVHTTGVCVFGLAVFMASDFLPINRFGLCMAALLSLALFADLVVLPAILLSPAGRWFLPRSHTKPQEP